MCFTALKSEEKIDIWKNKKKDPNTNLQKSNSVIDKDNSISTAEKIDPDVEIKIENGTIETDNEAKVYGIYEPGPPLCPTHLLELLLFQTYQYRHQLYISYLCLISN